MSKIPTKVPVIIKATVPAVPAILNPEEYLAFEAIVEMADEVLEWYDDLKTAIQKSRFATAERLQSAQWELDDADERLESIEDCARQLERFNPKSAYDGKGRITMAQASVHIAALVDGFPTKNAPDNFVDRLLLEVLTTRPSVVELEAACRQVLRSAESDFMPGAGKVIAAIKEQQAIWFKRTMAINGFARRVESLREAVAAGEAKLAAEEAKREERRRVDRLRAQPLAVGDRVRGCGKFRHAGPGTIEQEGSGGFTVMLDTACEFLFKPESLARLIPGDAGFELTDAERAEIEQKLAAYDKRISDEAETYYRITEKGLTAKKALLRIYD
jgi:hypothetical protein